jgi:D-sedoheptulose 7-phosphate isomerase
VDSLKSGGKILFFGNGGSAADAQHIATELTIRFVNDRPAIAAIALTTDTSTLTAAGNDYGFDHIFARQIEALGKPGDIAIGISTSGNSANILNAFIAAKAHDLTTIGFGGRDGGKMVPLCHHTLIVPNDETARIQEMHIVLGHMLCAAIEEGLGYA